MDFETEKQAPTLQDANIAGARIEDVNVADSSLSDANLCQVEISDANICIARLQDVSLSRVLFTDCRFQEVEIEASDLDGLRIDGIPATKLLEAYHGGSAAEDPPRDE